MRANSGIEPREVEWGNGGFADFVCRVEEFHFTHPTRSRCDRAEEYRSRCAEMLAVAGTGEIHALNEIGRSQAKQFQVKAKVRTGDGNLMDFDGEHVCSNDEAARTEGCFKESRFLRRVHCGQRQ